MHPGEDIDIDVGMARQIMTSVRGNWIGLRVALHGDR